MNKIILVFFLVTISNQKIFSQLSSDSIKISKNLVIGNVEFMKLYVDSNKRECDQKKAISIIFNDKISSCFDYVKSFSKGDCHKILKHINTSSTYGGEDVACFETDYALLLYNKQKTIIGYINISFFCNKLNSNPRIDAIKVLSSGKIRRNGFSKHGRKELLELLGLKESNSTVSPY